MGGGDQKMGGGIQQSTEQHPQGALCNKEEDGTGTRHLGSDEDNGGMYLEGLHGAAI